MQQPGYHYYQQPQPQPQQQTPDGIGSVWIALIFAIIAFCFFVFVLFTWFSDQNQGISLLADAPSMIRAGAISLGAIIVAVVLMAIGVLRWMSRP